MKSQPSFDHQLAEDRLRAPRGEMNAGNSLPPTAPSSIVGVLHRHLEGKRRSEMQYGSHKVDIT